MRTTIATIVAAALLAAGCATPRDDAGAVDGAGNCDTPAHAGMDFWIGQWDVAWTDADGNPAHGTNRVDRDAYGGCVVTERFDGRPGLPLQGMSVSVYDTAARTWRQTWVDNQGGYIALTGGPTRDGGFMLSTAVRPDQPRFRMTWSDISQTGFTWRWQRQQPGQNAWEDRWVLEYTRR